MNAFKKKRRFRQSLTWAGLPLVITTGWVVPELGFFLLVCMTGAVAISLRKGRAWCDWMCPRGSFFDLILARFSAQKEIPQFFRKKGFRIFVLAFMLSLLSVQIYWNWGDLNGIGTAMVKILTATTSVGIILGLIYHQRIWCHVCPMGTISNFISTGKYPLQILDSCSGCNVCAKVCPMQLKPHSFKGQGIVADNDCIKCSSCVQACPKKVLSFENNEESAGGREVQGQAAG
jgi:ferredoxin-type protein NapH